MEIDGKLVRELVSKGWTPPKRDYEEWRTALWVFYDTSGSPANAERVREGRAFLDFDRQTIDALALAFEAAPKVGHDG